MSPNARFAIAILLIPLTPLMLWGVAERAEALPDDRRKDIEITAERAVRDEKAGYTVYSGDVVLEQGSLQIEADKLTIFHDREAADRIVAIGAPARLRQQPEIDKGFVTAMAREIVYEKSTERVMLRSDASIEQDGAVVSGDSIDYFMAEQRVLADAKAADDSARVQVLIPAEALEDDETSAPPGSEGETETETETETELESTRQEESRRGDADSP